MRLKTATVLLILGVVVSMLLPPVSAQTYSNSASNSCGDNPFKVYLTIITDGHGQASTQGYGTWNSTISCIMCQGVCLPGIATAKDSFFQIWNDQNWEIHNDCGGSTQNCSVSGTTFETGTWYHAKLTVWYDGIAFCLLPCLIQDLPITTQTDIYVMSENPQQPSSTGGGGGGGGSRGCYVL